MDMVHFIPWVEPCVIPLARAGLNEREAPGKVVTARPPKRLAQLRIAFHIPSFQLCKRTGQKHQSLAAYTSETIEVNHVRRFVCGQFVQTESCITQKRSFCYRDATQLFYGLSDHRHCKNRPCTYRVAESEVKCPTFPKFPLRLLNIT